MTEPMETLAYAHAVKLARGCYQRAILDGSAAMSGADLKGKAADYAGQYSASRRHLLERLEAAQIPYHVAKRKHGKLVLVLGIW